MKSHISRSSRGFTLVELLVALGVTAIIITMLVTITATALDGWTASRNQVKASREAKAAFDQMARDLESLVVRSGNNYEWLWSSASQSSPGPQGNQSPNAAKIVFFTAATDRYDGGINTSADEGGDVSAVSYELAYRDPITDTENEEFATFVLYRQLVNPADAFQNLLAEEDLEQAFSVYERNQTDTENFLCENIYELSLSFLVEYTEEEVTKQERILLVGTSSQDAVQDFRLRGGKIIADESENQPYVNGRVLAAELSLTVIDDNVVEIFRNGANLPEESKQRLLERGSHHYSKTILLPQP